MDYHQRREKFRAVLAGRDCISPASVYDPLSARIAQDIGYEFGFLAGSVASETTLAAPDMLGGLTLTDLAGQIRRITRASTLSLLADADHGYGNALNVMRTVQELEHAGVAALTIEDTVLPDPFGQQEGVQALTSIEEGVGKMRAALAARQDPALVIIARTSLKLAGLDEFIARASAYARAGVDALFVAGGLKKLDQIEAMGSATGLPILLGVVPPELRREDLAARGARVLLTGHQPLAASIKALRDAYSHLYSGGAARELKDRTISSSEMERLIGVQQYEKWSRDYLR